MVFMAFNLIPSNLQFFFEKKPIPHSSIKETVALLIGAIKAGSLDDVKMLIEDLKNLGGKLDQEVGKGTTFLHQAAATEHIEIALELISQGIPLNALNEEGKTPMEIALYNGKQEMASILLSLGGTRESTDRKVLSHIWGLKGDTGISALPSVINDNSKLDYKTIRNEGLNPELMQSAFIKLTLSFFQSKQFKEMRSALDVEPISVAIQKIPENLTKPPKEIAQDILAGKIVLLPTGWTRHSTAVGFVNGDRVIKTNCARQKGLGKKQPVNRFFKMKKTDQLEECIIGIQKKSDRVFFKETMDKLLGLEPQEELIKSAQQGGHCTWASLKALFHAVLEVECGKINSDQAKAKLEAHRIYKAWKYYVSQASFVDYLYCSTNRSIEIVNLVHMKNKDREMNSKNWGEHVYEK